MKTSNKFKRIGLLLLVICFFLQISAQENYWSSKLNSLKVFIENKGQVICPEIGNEKIEYCYIGVSENFYFTKKGVIIEAQKSYKKKNPASWVKKIFKNEEDEENEISISKSFISAEWINTTENGRIEIENCAPGYFTFGKSQQICNGVKKLTYKNIYPNIDIVYTIPQDSSGIEYSLIVKPGADLSMVKLQYSGDIHKILLKQGNVEIETPSGNITEHAPVSFYENEKTNIASAFELENKTISFHIPSYDKTKVLIIDPWVASVFILGNDVAWNVDYDNIGNLYAYIRAGGTSAGSIYINKYSSAGTLLWSHIVTSSTQYEGDFLVAKSTGKVYISEGFNGGGAYVYRIDSAGIADGWSSQINSTYVEIWEMLFDKSELNLIAAGGGTQSNLNGGIIDIGTGALNIANFSGFGGICQDIVCGARDNLGSIYVIYSQTICGTAGQIDNKIELLNSTMNGPVWLAPSGFSAFLESANHFPSTGGQTSNGFNALAVNDNYLYYYDGGGFGVYDKTNGSILASTSVNLSGTYYMPLNQGGVAVDNCDNVYIGGPNSNLLIYKFNGTSLSLPQNMPLNWSGDKSVCDVKLDRINNLLFVSGVDNVGVYDIPIACTTQINSNESIENEYFQIYPNPAKDFLSIKISEPGVYTIVLFDITGKLVKDYKNINAGEFIMNTLEFERGNYVIKLINEQNVVIGVKKLSLK